jgi:hypothetical protein
LDLCVSWAPRPVGPWRPVGPGWRPVLIGPGAAAISVYRYPHRYSQHRDPYGILRCRPVTVQASPVHVCLRRPGTATPGRRTRTRLTLAHTSSSLVWTDPCPQPTRRCGNTQAVRSRARWQVQKEARALALRGPRARPRIPAARPRPWSTGPDDGPDPQAAAGFSSACPSAADSDRPSLTSSAGCCLGTPACRTSGCRHLPTRHAIPRAPPSRLQQTRISPTPTPEVDRGGRARVTHRKHGPYPGHRSGRPGTTLPGRLGSARHGTRLGADGPASRAAHTRSYHPSRPCPSARARDYQEAVADAPALMECGRRVTHMPIPNAA